jgi:hypothetical protein
MEQTSERTDKRQSIRGILSVPRRNPPLFHSQNGGEPERRRCKKRNKSLISHSLYTTFLSGEKFVQPELPAFPLRGNQRTSVVRHFPRRLFTVQRVVRCFSRRGKCRTTAILEKSRREKARTTFVRQFPRGGNHGTTRCTLFSGSF